MAGIYVHIPFCRAKCFYCDFYSLPRLEIQDKYTDALISEYELSKDFLNEEIKTIYFGGGTPSAMSIENLRRLYTNISESSVIEATIEVNPEDVSLEGARHWKNIGFNRVSMGIQSLNDNELNSVGRRHTAAEAVRAFYALREAGFSNISVDLIYGLPGQSLSSWETTLREIMNMRPEHLSAYSLSLEPGSRLYAMQQANKYVPTDENIVAQMYECLEQHTEELGMIHYEISNFSLPGYESKHNSSYWTGTPYLGLGPGAHSYDGESRYYNRPSLKEYLDKELIREKEPESLTDRVNDMIVTGLRTAYGLKLDSFLPQTRLEILKNSQNWLKTGKLRIEENILFIPSRFWMISDAIMRDVLL